MRTRVHIGIQKKAGNIPILSRCVGTTPTHLKTSDRYQQWSDRPRCRRSVLATLYDLSGAPFSSTIFYVGGIPSKQESTLSNIEKLSNLLHNVGALPSYVHHIL